MNDTLRKLKLPLMLLTYILYVARKAITPTLNREPRKILVLYLSGIGDIICQTEFYRQLKLRYPKSALWACLPAALVKLQDSYFHFDSYIAHRSYRQSLKELNAQGFDLIILPGWVLKDSILALLSNARAIVGYINDLSFSNKFVNSFRLEGIGLRAPRIVTDMGKTHLSERSNGIALALGMKPISADGIIITRIAKPENYLVFHASSQLQSKRWEPRNFAEVARYLLSESLADTIYLIGDKAEQALNDEIAYMCADERVINKSGKLSLMQSRELISKAKLFVGNDSGPMHIAALLGVPTLGLMGPYPPELCRPLGANSRYIFHRYHCCCCDPHFCGYAYRCMKAITVDEVINQCTAMLKEYD